LVQSQDGYHAIEDNHVTLALQFVQTHGGVPRMTQGVLSRAIEQVAREPQNRCDVLRDEIEKLPPWDGTPRIEPFWIDVTGCPDTPHTRAAGRNFWTALIARALRPAAKVDECFVLEGEQGSRIRPKAEAACKILRAPN